MVLTVRQRNARYFKKLKKERHWVIAFRNARCRCKYTSGRSPHRYFGRGIKFLLTLDDVKKLWFRDKANIMERASLDRIDNDGNYEYSNCRFIEQSQNTLRKPVYRPENCVSKYMGVCKGRYGKWLAQIQINGKKPWLGEFDTELEAHRAYKKAKEKISKKLDK